MRSLIYNYLGYKNVTPDDNVLKIIDECVEEVKTISRFKYYYQEYNTLFPFLKNNKNYLDYLQGSNSYFLVATTLGIEIDQRQKYYNSADSAKALIFDACSSAYVEFLADEYEKDLNRDLSFRFCPGYQGTSFLDNKIIAKEINATKFLGITFLESGLMVPLKSMIGIVAVGNVKKKSCKACIFMKNCRYLKEGLTCYQK